MKSNNSVVHADQQKYIDYFLSKPAARLVESNNLFKIITYDTIVKGTFKPCLACFIGSKPKPKINLAFPNPDERFKVLEDFKYSTIFQNQLRNERRKLKRIFTKINKL